MSSFKLAICSIFDPNVFGMDENSSPGILNHHLIIYTFKAVDFYNNNYKDIIDMINEEQNLTHYKLDIVKCETLSGLEQVGYIKTFWLKIVQRRWKKVYKERQDLLKKRSSIIALQERQQTGQWPKHLRQWPKFTLY